MEKKSKRHHRKGLQSRKKNFKVGNGKPVQQNLFFYLRTGNVYRKWAFISSFEKQHTLKNNDPSTKNKKKAFYFIWWVFAVR